MKKKNNFVKWAGVFVAALFVLSAASAIVNADPPTAMYSEKLISDGHIEPDDPPDSDPDLDYELNWETQAKYERHYSKIDVDDYGNSYIVANNPDFDLCTVMKLDPDGEVMWDIDTTALDLLPLPVEDKPPEGALGVTYYAFTEENLIDFYDLLNIDLSVIDDDFFAIYLSDVVVDNYGDIVVAGWTLNVTFINDDLFYVSMEGYVAKHNPGNGDVDWERKFWHRAVNYVMAATVTTNNRIYIAEVSVGFIDGAFTESHGWIAKYNPLGVRTGGFTYDPPDLQPWPYGICADGTSVWMTGTLFDIGGLEDGDCDMDMFVVKYGQYGVKYDEWYWDYSHDCPSYIGWMEVGDDIAVGPDGKIYVAGFYAEQLTNGNTVRFRDPKPYMAIFKSNGDFVREIVEDMNDCQFHDIDFFADDTDFSGYLATAIGPYLGVWIPMKFTTKIYDFTGVHDPLTIERGSPYNTDALHGVATYGEDVHVTGSGAMDDLDPACMFIYVGNYRIFED